MNSFKIDPDSSLFCSNGRGMGNSHTYGAALTEAETQESSGKMS